MDMFEKIGVQPVPIRQIRKLDQVGHSVAIKKPSVAIASANLRWFFQEAEGELGVKAIDYEALSQTIAAGGTPGAALGILAADRIHELCRRVSETWRRLRAISAEQRRILETAFSANRIDGLEGSSDLVAVQCLIAGTLSGYGASLVPDGQWSTLELGRRRIVALRAKGRYLETSELRTRAEKTLSRALTAYGEAKL